MFVAVEPAGKYAYRTQAFSDGVHAYAIDPGTGALTEVPGSPYATRTWPVFIAFDPTGKFVYVANRDSLSISAYAINTSTGVLSAIPGSPFTTGQWPASIATIRIEQ